MSDWRVDLLREMGAPVTEANMRFLSVWQRAEGGHTNNKARWNWLNTTMGSSFPSINSVGVRSYPSYGTGISYTARTLRNGRYPNIVRGLQAGDPYKDSAGVAGDLSTWVSGSRSGNIGYAQKVLGGIGGTPSQSMVPGGSTGCGGALMLAALYAGFVVGAAKIAFL